MDLKPVRCKYRKLAAGATLLFAALAPCGSCTRERPEDLYRRVNDAKKNDKATKALSLAEEGSRKFGAQAEPVWHWQFELVKGEILLVSGETERAVELFDRLEPVLPRGGELEARYLVDRGETNSRLGQYERAREQFERASKVAESRGLTDLRIEAEGDLGSTLIELREIPAAEAHYRKALALARQEKSLFYESSELGNLGYLCLRTGRYDEGVTWFTRSLDIAKRLKDTGLMALSFDNLGWCYYRSGDADRARPLFEQAQKIFESVNDMSSLQVSLANLGDSSYESGDVSGANSYFRRSLDISRRLKDANWTAANLTSLSATEIDQADIKAAKEHNAEARGIFANLKSPNQFWSDLNNARIAAVEGDNKFAIEIYRKVMQEPDAEAALQIEARTRLAKLLSETGDTEGAEKEYRSALEVADSLRAGFVLMNSKLSFNTVTTRLVRHYVDFLVAHKHPIQALQVANAGRALLLSGRAVSIPKNLPEKSFLQSQAARCRGTILFYWVAPSVSYRWTVTPEDTEIAILPPEREIAELVKRHNSTIASLRETAESAGSSSRRLSEILLSRSVEAARRADTLVIAPDGPLYDLNFETLPSIEKPNRFVIQDFKLAVVPFFGDSRAKKQQRRPTLPLLAIGDAVSPDPAQFPDLPQAGNEIEGIARLFPGSVLRKRDQAYPQAYFEERPERFAMLHFATHATANPVTPLDSAVILSRRNDSFKLYAREIIDHPICAELVTLSSCRSAGARTYAGEGLVGFAWAFLKAGAHSVVAGLWKVDDVATRRMMERMYEAVGEGESASNALRTAKLALIEQGGTFAKPYYWGAFQLYAISPEQEARFRIASVRLPENRLKIATTGAKLSSSSQEHPRGAANRQ